VVDVAGTDEAHGRRAARADKSRAVGSGRRDGGW
jgi:hypothetical protein